MQPSRAPGRLPTFFAPPLGGRVAGQVVDLSPEEARHHRIARLAADGVVTLTDGEGSLWRARVERADGRRMRVVLLEPLRAPPALPVMLAFAVASRPRTLWLVEKAVEYGVSKLQPVEFALSRSVADAGRTPAFWQKARRRMISALKQSGRGQLPKLATPVPLDSLPDTLAEDSGPRILLDVTGPSLWKMIAPWAGGTATVLVGPEGGVEGAERNRLAGAGFGTACVSEGMLRFETAAVAALAVVWQRWAQERRSERGGTEPQRADSGGEP